MNADERGLNKLDLSVQTSMGRFGCYPLGQRLGERGGGAHYLLD